MCFNYKKKSLFGTITRSTLLCHYIVNIKLVYRKYIISSYILQFTGNKAIRRALSL